MNIISKNVLPDGSYPEDRSQCSGWDAATLCMLDILTGESSGDLRESYGVRADVLALVLRTGIAAAPEAEGPEAMTLAGLRAPAQSCEAVAQAPTVPLSYLGGYTVTKRDRSWWDHAISSARAAVAGGASAADAAAGVAPLSDEIGRLAARSGQAGQHIDGGGAVEGAQLLARGVDTLELTLGVSELMIADDLDLLKKEAKISGDVRIYAAGGYTFELAPHGARSMPYLLKGNAASLSLSRSKIKITLRASYLWALGVDRAVDLLIELVEGWARISSVNVSRIDLCADFQGIDFSPMDLLEGCFVTRARNRSMRVPAEYGGAGERRIRLQTNKVDDFDSDAIFYNGRRFTGYTFGAGGAINAVIYNKTEEMKKSGKKWFERIWETSGAYDPDGGPVWRVEFRVKSEALSAIWAQVLRGGQIRYSRGWVEVRARIAGLWRFLTGGDGVKGRGWLTMRRAGSSDSNASRRGIDPRWEAIRAVGWGRVWAAARIPRRNVDPSDGQRVQGELVLAAAVGVAVEDVAAAELHRQDETVDVMRARAAAAMGGALDVRDLSTLLKSGLLRVGEAAAVEVSAAVERAAALGAQVRGVVAAYAAAVVAAVDGGWEMLGVCGADALSAALSLALSDEAAELGADDLCERAERRLSQTRARRVFEHGGAVVGSCPTPDEWAHATAKAATAKAAAARLELSLGLA